MASPQPNPPQPPNKPKTILGTITQAFQSVQSKVDFSKLVLKPNARVPELWVQDADAERAEIYPLLGDRYLLGRSSKSCDIVVRNPVVSQVHASLARNSQQASNSFVIKDENSTNGVYLGKRRVSRIPLRHGDILTLGPPELAAAVRLQYMNPPPWYMQAVRYGVYGALGITALAAVWIGVEWQKFSVRPLPVSVQGPVVVYAGDDETPLRAPRNQAHMELERLSDYSPYLPKAVIASEDTRYYWHLGIDPIGILRALLTNIQGGEIREGGSTISQQLARSVYRDYVGTEDSPARKLREAVVALKLETFYSKDFLLLTYLNRVYLGSGNSGFEDAAQFYFDKSARDLTLSEAATLVGILPAPNRFNPIRDYEAAVSLRNRVINRMAALGMVNQEEAQRARRSRIEISPKAIEELESTIAPYFYAQVFFELETLLGSQLAQEGNFIVETELDTQLQTDAENSLQETIANQGVTLGFSQGALITLNAETGAVQALVGGSDFQQSQFNRATQALRQPGSTFKVFAYATALSQGISPGTQFSCAPLTWEGQNFSGCRSGSGSMDMYSGLARSENVVALRIAQEVGLNRIVQTARRMGIQSELNPVPGLILGQSEVTLKELTGAFGTFANQGIYNRPHLISRILDSSDCANPDDRSTCREIYRFENDAESNIQVLEPAVADRMTGLLQGVIQGGTGRNAYIGRGEAGKTGTTNDNVDLWFVGYVPRQKIVTGVWLGNDDNTPTAGSSAQAAELWGDYMAEALP
jgi:1A family penicillin-binding protein